MHFENLFRRIFRNVFDVHATGRAVDESGATGCSIEGQGQVHLFDDVDLLDEVYSVAWQTIGSTLVGNQSFSEHLRGHGFCLISVINEVDTTLETGFFEVTETATATKDLRLDNHAAGDAVGNFFGLIWAESYITDGNGHLV